jgi:hypothetical protein
VKTSWRVIKFIALWSLACVSSTAWAEPLQLQPAQTLMAGTNVLVPGSYAFPCVADWNGDRRKDLLVGYQNAGKIALYLNSGTEVQPAFTNSTTLRAWVPSATSTNWQEIVHPSPGCGAPAPWVCDFDGDGRRDLLVGAGADGTVWFYRNTNTDAAPILVQVGQLKVGTGVLSVGLRSAPCVYDWDGDGLNDLLCGSGGGPSSSEIFWFRNTNTAQAPIYAPGGPIQAGGVDLQLGIRSVPRMVDWDGDGLNDLICSCDTNVVWCRNTNRSGAPVLESPLPICAPVAGKGLVPIAASANSRLRFWPVDWNNDGIMDLLLSDLSGKIAYYQGYHFAAIQVAPRPGGQLMLQWNSAPYLTYSVLANVAPNQVAQPVAINLPSGGAITFWTNDCQGRCLFYRIQIP